MSLSFCFDHQSTVLMSLLCVCFCSYTSSNKALNSIEEVDPHIQLVGWMTPLHQEKSGETKRKIYTYYKLCIKTKRRESGECQFTKLT